MYPKLDHPQTKWNCHVTCCLIWFHYIRNLYKFAHYKKYAQETFLEHEDFYHPIAAQMIRQDLELGSK